MYGIDGRTELPERELGHLAGYQGSQPVRIGNAAATQLQLDIYGELMDSVYLYDRWHQPISSAQWDTIITGAEWLCDHWDQPDEGIWGDSRRPQEVPVPAAHVLGGDGAGDPAGHPPGPARRPGPLADGPAALAPLETGRCWPGWPAGSAGGRRYPEARWSRAPATLGRPSAAEIVQVTNFVGPMCGLSEVISWTCGGVRMNSRSAVLSVQTDRVQ